MNWLRLAAGLGNANDLNIPVVANPDNLFRNVVNLILTVAGVVAVFLILFAGILYASSNGNPARIKTAKDTWLWALIGLAVVVAGFAVVKFVIGRL